MKTLTTVTLLLAASMTATSQVNAASQQMGQTYDPQNDYLTSLVTKQASIALQQPFLQAKHLQLRLALTGHMAMTKALF